MNRKAVFSFFALIVITISPVIGLPASVNRAERPALSASLSAEEFRIFERVNSQRNRLRLSGLEWDDRLAELARAYSERMAREHFFDHWDSNGETVVDRARRARIGGWKTIGENLFVCEGVDSGLSDFAVAGWMKSATHRENMLDRKWTATGVGIARARDGSIYITEVFIEE
jgi:uncharacterized protein YkwD